MTQPTRKRRFIPYGLIVGVIVGGLLNRFVGDSGALLLTPLLVGGTWDLVAFLRSRSTGNAGRSDGTVGYGGDGGGYSGGTGHDSHGRDSHGHDSHGHDGGYSGGSDGGGGDGGGGGGGD